MQNIQFHIAYLLTKHECLTIPGLGAFLVSHSERKEDGEIGFFEHQAHTLWFNSEISHNDGLLTNSIAKEKNIPYKEAAFLVKQYCEQLKTQLNIDKNVQFPWVGSLHQTAENRIVFTPAAQLSCNSTNFGFTNFSLSPLKEIQREVESNERKSDEKTNKNTDEVILIPVNRRIVHWTGSVAAAALALFLITTPLNNYSSKKENQQASFLNISAKSFSYPKKTVENTKETSVHEIQEAVAASENDKKEEVVVQKNVRYYHIVIASLPTKQLAEKKVAEFQEKGFHNASIISNGDKHRIYTNRFEDKAKAEAFLAEFRINYPQHAKAWLLAQRN